MLRLDWNLPLTIINLIILYVCMKKFLYGPIVAIMDKRQTMIREQLANASQTEDEARQMKSQYEAALQGAKDESGKIVDQAKAEAKSEYERIVGDAGREAGRILKDARTTVEAEKEQALAQIQSQIAGLAMTAAEQLLVQKSSAENDSRMYDAFLEEAGDAHDTDSH